MKRAPFLLIFFLCLCGEVFAVPAFDAVSTYTSASSGTVSGSHTVGGGCTNTFAVVTVASQGSQTAISALSYGATALTPLKNENLGDGNSRIELWGVKAPPTGAQTVSATLGATQNSNTMTVRTYCNVDQTTSIGTAVSTSGTGETASLNVGSGSNEVVVDGVMLMSVSPLTVDGAQTQRSNFAQDVSNHTQGTSEKAGPGTVAMSWTWTGLGSNYWGQVGVSLKPSAAGGGASKRRIVNVQ